MQKPVFNAVLAYITPIGWVLAILMNHGVNAAFVNFHLRQAGGIFLVYFALVLATSITVRIPFIGIIAGGLAGIIGLLLLGFLAYGAICALQGREKTVPFIGNWSQDKLRMIIP